MEAWHREIQSAIRDPDGSIWAAARVESANHVLAYGRVFFDEKHQLCQEVLWGRMGFGAGKCLSSLPVEQLY